MSFSLSLFLLMKIESLSSLILRGHKKDLGMMDMKVDMPEIVNVASCCRECDACTTASLQDQGPRTDRDVEDTTAAVKRKEQLRREKFDPGCDYYAQTWGTLVVVVVVCCDKKLWSGSVFLHPLCEDMQLHSCFRRIPTLINAETLCRQDFHPWLVLWYL